MILIRKVFLKWNFLTLPGTARQGRRAYDAIILTFVFGGRYGGVFDIIMIH
jgi:hypothetical protein